ncbi:MAG: heme exporter protein CcmD [Ectothiorhodospiraceae bacterium]|jgi:heme exporter protein D
MGGYAFYVWTSYGLAAAVLLANVLAPTLRHRSILRTVARRRRP